MSFEDKQHVCSDCWIIARDAERERILALLRHLRSKAKDQGLSQTANINAIIALINGENK